MKGRNIIAPKSLPVRPTTDFAKTALFNILNNRFDYEELRVLDLFSGTGCISYEFASRGCIDITCVDEHHHCTRFIKETASKLGIKGLKIAQADVFKYLERCVEKFDIIFADPPFELKETDRIPQLVFEKKLLRDGGLLIIEHATKRVLESTPLPDETRPYSNCAFSFFGLKPEVKENDTLSE
jgi:16S rRNA (guanine966-N2)-methyltransferase